MSTQAVAELHGEPTSSSVEKYWPTVLRPRLDYLSSLDVDDDRVRALIDGDIGDIHEVIRVLNTCRNDRAPISRIPSELLGRIFHFLSRREALQPRTPEAGWISVTHVCRRWRHTALQYPGLWSNIIFSLGLRWTEEMLARSKTVPLDVLVTGTLRPRESQLVIEHLDRTEDLHLTAPVQTLLQDLTTEPVPVLTTFEISSVPEYSPLMLPEDLFAHSAPRLQTLIIHNCVFSWPSLVFNSITYLNIWSPLQAMYVPNTAEQFLDFLRDCPNLEDVRLYGCIPRLPLHHLHNIHMQRLKRLDVLGPARSIVGVLDHLHAVPGASLRLTVRFSMRDDRDDDSRAVIPSVSAHLGDSHHSSPLLVLSIAGGGARRTVVVTAWTVIQASETVPTPALHMELELRRLPAIDMLTHLRDGLHLGSLRVASVDTTFNRDWSVLHWDVLFAHSMDMRHVILSGQLAAETLFETSCGPVGAAQSNQASGYSLFPSLVTISISRVNFIGEDHAGTSQPPAPVVQPALAWLQLQCRHNLRKVNISECWITPDIVDAMRETVTDVVWDEQVEPILSDSLEGW
ncbi:hypothetical protein BV25DRAFT_714199 [Artomyces pyxidatus]|uniref:Uncharacterized protein n=1 Tax=Artomyces pyxidatus TaxID=48021 RepID=A0ACB8T086_9AGAM|nr:hypothetical protein BV25DRAFT_714199 [Artomyces pyxidatus]